MAEKRGQYQYNDDGTVSQLVSITEAAANGSGLGVTTGDILPVDIQSRYAQTIQTHNAVSVATGWSNGLWQDADGFDKVAVTLKNDASTSNTANIEWSNDGVAIQGVETIIANSTTNNRSAITEIKMRYFRVNIYNGDAVAHTMSAWAYLKA